MLRKSKQLNLVILVVINISNHTDINECSLGLDTCGSNSYCVNVVGSYKCQCIMGYEQHKEHTCQGTHIVIIASLVRCVLLCYLNGILIPF